MTEIKITRRVALDKPYEYYELEATYDPAEVKGNKAIKDIEKQVAFIRKLTGTVAPKEETEPKVLPTGSTMVQAKKKAPKIPTKKKAAPEGTEDIKIADLKEKDKVNLNVRFIEAGDIKRFDKADGTQGKYCKVDVEDDSGRIKITLFDEQIDLIEGVKKNAWMFIQNGYVKDYKGNLELSIAYGTMEAVFNG